MSDGQPLKDIHASLAKYPLLRHIRSLQGQVRVLRLLNRIAREGMRAAAANPDFARALRQKNIRLAGTLAHSALAKTAKRYIGAFKQLELKLTVEERIVKGKGGSQLDLRIQGLLGKKPIHIILDHKTTGQSALHSVKQAEKHAGHVLGKHLPELKTRGAAAGRGVTQAAGPGKRLRTALGNRPRTFARHPGAAGGQLTDHVALNWIDFAREFCPVVAKWLPKPKAPRGATKAKGAGARAVGSFRKLIRTAGRNATPATVSGQGVGATNPVKPATPPSEVGQLRNTLRAALGKRPLVFARHLGVPLPSTRAATNTLRPPSGSQLKNVLATAARGRPSGLARQPAPAEPLAKTVRRALHAPAPATTGKANQPAAVRNQQLSGSVRAALRGRVNIGRSLSGTRGMTSGVGGVFRAAGSIVKKLLGG
jgi:hypothetical protein